LTPMLRLGVVIDTVRRNQQCLVRIQIPIGGVTTNVPIGIRE